MSQIVILHLAFAPWGRLQITFGMNFWALQNWVDPHPLPRILEVVLQTFFQNFFNVSNFDKNFWIEPTTPTPRVTQINSSLVIFIIISVYLSISMSVVSHLIDHLVNLHDQHHNISNITSISIINYQSLISKVFSRYLHLPGSHQSTRFLQLLTHSLTPLLERLAMPKRYCHITYRLMTTRNICVH